MCLCVLAKWVSNPEKYQYTAFGKFNVHFLMQFVLKTFLNIMRCLCFALCITNAYIENYLLPNHCHCHCYVERRM